MDGEAMTDTVLSVPLRSAIYRDEREVGTKAALLSLAMSRQILVPRGFVLTSHAMLAFLKETGLHGEILQILSGIDFDDPDSISFASQNIKKAIMGKDLPKALKDVIKEEYRRVGSAEEMRHLSTQQMDMLSTGSLENLVAVRASPFIPLDSLTTFPGMYDSKIYVRGLKGLYEAIKECWASFFSEDAIYAREKHTATKEMGGGVIVQLMVEADTSGRASTINPITKRENEILIEAGIGPALVGEGKVFPDQFIVDSTSLSLLRKRRGMKEWKRLRHAVSGAVTDEKLPPDVASDQCIRDEEAVGIARLAIEVKNTMGGDVIIDWAIKRDRLYLLGVRKYKTKREDKQPEAPPGEKILAATPVSQGVSKGRIERVESIEALAALGDGSVSLLTRPLRGITPRKKRLSGLILGFGGVLSDTAILARELGIPSIALFSQQAGEIRPGEEVVIDGSTGTLYKPRKEETPTIQPREILAGAEPRVRTMPPEEIVTATKVKVLLETPGVPSDPGDGVGLLHSGMFLLNLGSHPEKLVEAGHGNEVKAFLEKKIVEVAEAIYPRPLTIQTLDAPTTNLGSLPGGEGEHREENPRLGLRGVRRSMARPELFRIELGAIAGALARGYDNLEVLVPMVSHPEEVRFVREEMKLAGIDTEIVRLGILASIPATLFLADELSSEGVSFVVVDLDELSAHMLAVDPSNPLAAPHYKKTHRGVLRALKKGIEEYRSRNVEVVVKGSLLKNHAFLESLVKQKIDGVIVPPSEVGLTRAIVARTERRMLLDIMKEKRELWDRNDSNPIEDRF